MKTIKNHKLKLKTKIQKFIARKSNTQKHSIKCFEETKIIIILINYLKKIWKELRKIYCIKRKI